MHPLASEAEVAEYERRKKAADTAKGELNSFLGGQANDLVDAFAARTADYLMATRQLLLDDGVRLAALATETGLDAETLERWRDYLAETIPEFRQLFNHLTD